MRGPLPVKTKRVLDRVTARQVAANRANAAKSTGPRTEEGKQRSATNAITHGLLCDTARVGEFPEEARDIYEALRDELVAELDPQGQVQRLLAERVVAAAWRLRRAGRLEQMLMRNLMTEIEQDRMMGAMLLDPGRECDLQSAVAGLFKGGHYEQLSRYEVRIERGMYKALHELQRLQAAGRGEPVPPPVAVDVDVSGL